MISLCQIKFSNYLDIFPLYYVAYICIQIQSLWKLSDLTKIHLVWQKIHSVWQHFCEFYNRFLWNIIENQDNSEFWSSVHVHPILMGKTVKGVCLDLYIQTRSWFIYTGFVVLSNPWHLPFTTVCKMMTGGVCCLKSCNLRL